MYRVGKNPVYMYKIAIVEDTPQERDYLLELLKRYEEEHKLNFEFKCFDNGYPFLNQFKPEFDVVFMDIAMPGMNGVEVSAKLREIDPRVSLIFVTNLAQYAIKGYEVSALDFLLKPIGYSQLSHALAKAFSRVDKKNAEDIVIKTAESFAKLSCDDILYISSDDHLVIYHTKENEYETWDTLKEVQNNLPENKFYRFSKSVILNLFFVKGIKNGEVLLKNGKSFAIPRGKKREFVSAMSKFLDE